MLAKHPIYDIEIEPLSHLDHFGPMINSEERIYTVFIGDGMELAFLVGYPKIPSESDVLRVGFHAAKGRRDKRNHMFTPLGMARESGDAYVLFSDPTLTISRRTILTWYLGTPEVNPDDAMEIVVRRLLDETNAKYLLVEGSSGGGFAAMRFAARFRNAVAVPKIPQTDLFRYKAPWLAEALSESGWSGYSYESILESFPQRFRIADIYNNDEWNRKNLVHYVQNIGDTVHVEDQLKPLLYELGTMGSSFSARKGQFSISRPFTGGGHIAVPKAHWLAENQFALARLRKIRPTPLPEDVWLPPKSNVADPSLRERREKNIGLHLQSNKIW